MKRKQLICFLLLVCSVLSPLIGQHGYPFVRNFDPKEVGGHPQNWASLMDSRGIMYFGNTYGLIEYDGNDWKVIPGTENQSVNGLIQASWGEIFATIPADFGVVKPDSTGEMAFHSLKHLFPKSITYFDYRWKIYEVDNQIFLKNAKNLFVYNREEIKVFPQKLTGDPFTVDGKLYAQVESQGLCLIENNDFKQISNSTFFQQHYIYAYAELDDQVILGSGAGHCFEVDKTAFSNPNEEITARPLHSVAEQSKGHALYFILSLPDGGYAMGVREVGLCVFDKNHQHQYTLTDKNGLQVPEVYGGYLDRQNNLWLSMSSGISRVDLYSPVTKFTKENGFNNYVIGLGEDSTSIIATAVGGVYRVKDKPVRIPGDNNAWVSQNYQHADGSVSCFVSTRNSWVEIVGDKMEVIDHIMWYYMDHHPSFENRVYLGSLDGLYTYRYRNGKWQDKVKLWNSNLGVAPVRFGEDGSIWFSKCYADGLYKGTLNEAGDSLVNIEQHDSLSLLYHNDYIVSKDGKRFYRYEDGQLARQHELEKKLDHLPNYQRGGDEFPDGSYTFHIKEDGRTILRLVQADGSVIKTPFKVLPAIEHDDVYKDQKNNLWIASPEGIFRMDLDRIPSFDQQYHTLIRKVNVGKHDSLVFSGTFFEAGDSSLTAYQPEGFVPELDFVNNSILFRYASTYFGHGEKNQFSYFLDGYDEEWSSWSAETKKEYTNLPEGEYQFRVKSRNLYGKESEEAVYRFSISPPWYRTYTAQTSYIVVAIFFIWGIARVNSIRLQKENQKLEAIVKKRTEEVVKQKEEIEYKNEELQQQKEEILAQSESLIEMNELINKKNRSITDSIEYAYSLQSSILPPQNLLKSSFENYCVLYEPKDIVSGDVYWTHQLEDGKIMWAAIDCTGHGVPGAMMSMLATSSINQVIIENKNHEPGKILDQLRTRIIKTIDSGKEGGLKDGFDIALCLYDPETKMLQYAGAYNPLWVIRPRTADTPRPEEPANCIVKEYDFYYFIEYKADKQPVGMFKDMQPFTTQHIQLQENDSLYIFSDGFADQIGGPHRKRFKAANMREMIVKAQNIEMQYQKDLFKETFDSWLTSLPQMDDIVVFGVKI